MLNLWGRVAQIAPVFGAFGLLICSTKAMANNVFAIAQGEVLKKNSIHKAMTFDESKNFNQLDKNTSTILNRQADIFNNISDFQSENKLVISQVTRAEQLRDIKATDWSYEALRGLIDRYGCVGGFPDLTYRGEQTISRKEFAAGLDSCLNKIEAVLTNSDRMPQVDVETVLRLMQEFQSDLAILQGRTDGSQARIEDLETIQFSTTTKLQGEAVFSLGDVLSPNDRTSTVLGSRLRLDLRTSFSGNDLLLTRLSRNDLSGFVEEVGTFQGNLSVADSDAENFGLEELSYSFGIVDTLDLIIGATGVDAEDIAGTINVLDGDGGSGSISRFGTRNPIYEPPGDTGIGVVHRPIEEIEISAGYLASPANESTPGSGLFNGDYSALGQIKVAPFESFRLAATYVHSYNQSDTETGTNRANIQAETTAVFGEETPTVSNSYGLELSWAISDRFVIGGWGGLSKVSNLSTLNSQIDRGTLDIWNWTASLAFPDLGKEGSMAGIVVGSEPTVTNSTIENLEAYSDRSLHLEAFYQYQLNDNIAVTPGVVWITQPDSNIENSDDLVIGTIRTTFSF